MVVWTANEPKCASQSFNSSNEVYRWRNVWPKIAEYFGMESAGPDPDLNLEELLKDRHATWGKLLKRHGLSEPNLDRVFNFVHLALQMQLCWDTIIRMKKQAF
eukprot:TRINITY_DN12277_c0_g1_i1.p1 TRINITY_DN12277_c0_g1~~TRINITY_DN12277_c0_g1_i1.p1  ORF type:complete len:103 (-),score=15.32 TRINITY_DN12277_c0_g1_i1:120-428(-)